MTAAVALKACEVAGVMVELRATKLLLQASTRPPKRVVEAVVRHRGGIADLLRERDVVYDTTASIRRSGNVARAKGIRARPSPDWAEALAALSLCPRVEGFSPNQWERILSDAERFVEVWADRANALGWNLLDVFGLHIRAPAARYDVMGLIPLVRGGEVVALGEDRATIRMPTGSQLTYLKNPSSEAIPIWALGPAQGEHEGAG